MPCGGIPGSRGMLHTVSAELTPRMMRLQLTADDWKRLRVMAAERGCSMQALVAEWVRAQIVGPLREPARVIGEALYREASPAPQKAPLPEAARSPVTREQFSSSQAFGADELDAASHALVREQAVAARDATGIRVEAGSMRMSDQLLEQGRALEAATRADERAVTEAMRSPEPLVQSKAEMEAAMPMYRGAGPVRPVRRPVVQQRPIIQKREK